MIIDMHTHAGWTGRTRPIDRAVLDGMRAAGVAAAVVSAVPDLPLLKRDPVSGRLMVTREPRPGECLAMTDTALSAFEAAGMRIAREPEEIRADDPALVLGVEGCDFLEGDLDRLHDMEARGVRSIQLTHYRVNETGDIQTAAPVHGGLTRFGADTVRRMNRLGLMVDVAHCSEATARGVAETTSKPILCTHANLLEPGHKNGAHPRFISLDYARLVAGTGGVIGGWIAVLYEEKLPGMIRHIFRLIEAVGIDHVGIGTDLPSGSERHGMADFSAHPDIVARLRAGGLDAAETDKICGGNWLRVFRAVRG